MPGTENFNDGATLAAKGWTDIVNASNAAAAGEDGSYALSSSNATGHATMPIMPCGGSRRLQITWRWRRSSALLNDTFFLLVGATGADNDAWGGVSGDNWLVSLGHFNSGLSAAVVTGRALTSSDAGVNVWSIPDFVPPVDTWRTYRIDIDFSSAFEPNGRDGVVKFGVYPGTNPSNPGPTPGGSMDGRIRVYWGTDVDNLVLKADISGVAVPHPTMTSPPQIGVPYTYLNWVPAGIIDDITWDDFCTTVIPSPPGWSGGNGPLSPLVPCEPEEPIDSGGTGNSGCNVGGEGRIPVHESYAGPYGDIPVHADPIDGETLTGKSAKGVEPWIVVHHREYPSDTITTHQRAMVELADPPTVEGGRKVAGLMAIGTVQNSLGNEQGRPEAGSVDIRSSDAKDRWMRELVETQDLSGDELHIKFWSDVARAAGTPPPHTIARVRIDDAVNTSPMQSTISGTDVLFSPTGPFGPNNFSPFWTFKDLGIAAPNLPEDLKDVPIPIGAGWKSDQGARTRIGGVLAEKGLCPLYYIGRFTMAGAPPPVATAGRPLSEVVNQLQELIDDNVPNNEWEDELGYDIGASVGGDIDRLRAMGIVPSTYIELARVIGYGDLDALLAMGSTPPSGSDEWGILVAGLGPWWRIDQMFGSNLGNGDSSATHDRVELNLSTRIGLDILVHRWGSMTSGLDASWPLATSYIPFTNENGVTFWLACVLVRGPLLEDHINGVVNMTVNAWMADDVGDGTGLPFLHAHRIKHWFVENHLINRWTSGAYTDASTFPQWNDGTPMVRSSSYVARQAFTAASLGGLGLTGALYLPDGGGRRAAVDVHGDLNTWTETFNPINGHGQICDFGFDETLDPTNWPAFDHVTSVFGPVTQVMGVARNNVVSSECDWDPDKGTYRLVAVPRSSAAGIQKAKGQRLPGDLVSNGMLFDPLQQTWVDDRRLRRLEFGMRFVEAPGKQDWLDYDINAGIQLTSDEGYGATGYVQHKFVIWRRKFDVSTRKTTYTLWDVQQLLLETLYPPASPGAPSGLDRQFLITDVSGDAPLVTDDDTLAPLVL